jgi:hypothetical protein
MKPKNSRSSSTLQTLTDITPRKLLQTLRPASSYRHYSLQALTDITPRKLLQTLRPASSYKHYVLLTALLLITLPNCGCGCTVKAISLKVTQISSGKSDKDRDKMQMRQSKFNKLRITHRLFSIYTAHSKRRHREIKSTKTAVSRK